MPSPGRPKAAHLTAFGHQDPEAGAGWVALPRARAAFTALAAELAEGVEQRFAEQLGLAAGWKTSVLGGLQLAATASSEGEAGSRAAVHT